MGKHDWKASAVARGSVFHRAVALVFVNLAGAFAAELVIGQAALMQGGALFVQVRLGAVALCLLLRDPGSPLRRVGSLGARLGFPAMAGGDFLTALLQLALVGPLMRTGAGPRNHDTKHDEEEDHDYDDHNDQTG